MNYSHALAASIVALGVTASLGSTYAFQGQGVGMHTGNGASITSTTLEQETVTSSIEEGLLFMREEEKLARDVYQYFADLYGTKVFSNIAVSEQNHMERVGELLETYGIQDPAIPAQVGVFENDGLQSLYDTLILQGSVSLQDALQVGVTIEEKDIADLEDELQALTQGTDIYTVYSSLLRGSTNHLRAFTRNLDQGSNTGANHSGSANNTGQGRGRNLRQGKNGEGRGLGQGNQNK